MPVTRATRASWLLWTIAIIIYIFSIFHRSSLGVAGLQATERFGIGPTALSAFTVLQVAIYAVMQVPTGMLADRFGPRVMLTASALLLGGGQILFGLAHAYPVALLARAVLGVGDALTWISVLRVVASKFPARMYPLIVALSGTLGSIGSLVATIPLTMLLASHGWTGTFLIAGAMTAGYTAVIAAGLRVPAHPVAHPAETMALRGVLRGVRKTWRVPGTRLGFWVHFTTGVSANTLSLLWGFPYLVQAQHLSAADAGNLLAILVIGGIISNPIIGAVLGRHPHARMPWVGAVLAAMAGTWLLLETWPTRLPFGVLAVALVVFSLGGPTSQVGFGLARDYNPLHRVSTATGVVNVGGFVATMIAALGVGVLVSVAGVGNHALAYRIGLVAVVAVLLVGCWRVAVWWRKARAVVLVAASRGEEVPVRLRRRRWDVIPAEYLDLVAVA